jgi:hypothetical protein
MQKSTQNTLVSLESVSNTLPVVKLLSLLNKLRDIVVAALSANGTLKNSICLTGPKLELTQTRPSVEMLYVATFALPSISA